jgi:hypothetical protein
MAIALSFLNVILKGLKQKTSNGCNACDVWDGSVSMSNLISLACSIASKVTWLPCPSKINKCLLMNDTPPVIDLLKQDFLK